MRVLTVCLGNICRSPTAEAALREAADRAGVALEVDSAGTAGYHVGEPPDRRMTEAADRVGLRLTGSARQVRPQDLEAYDVVLAMDRDNAEDLREIAPTPDAVERIRLFREFDPEADGDLDVPDPYYGGKEGFDHVVRMVRRTAQAFVERHAAEGS